MTKQRNNSNKKKLNTIAVKDTSRTANVSRIPKDTKQNKQVDHKEPFILRFQSMEQEGSYDEWIKLIHDHAIEKYGEMAQEILRNEQIADPAVIVRPPAGSGAIIIQEYNVQYKNRLDDLNQRKKDRIKIIGYIRTHLSREISDELNQTLPDALTDGNIPMWHQLRVGAELSLRC